MMNCHYHYTLRIEPSSHFWKHYKCLSPSHTMCHCYSQEEQLVIDGCRKREETHCKHLTGRARSVCQRSLWIMFTSCSGIMLTLCFYSTVTYYLNNFFIFFLPHNVATNSLKQFSSEQSPLFSTHSLYTDQPHMSTNNISKAPVNDYITQQLQVSIIFMAIELRASHRQPFISIRQKGKSFEPETGHM